MTLKDGLYRIRFVPVNVQPPFLGGLYATATEFGEPILAEPEQHEGLQTWQVRCNEKDGTYTITQPGFKSKHSGVGPVLCGWGLANPAQALPTGGILFKVDTVNFDIQPRGEGEHLMYTVRIPTLVRIGAYFFVTERDQTLVSQMFPIGGPDEKLPYPHWQFIPA